MSTEAKRRGNAAYQRRQDALTIRPGKDEGARIRQAAADAGMSVQGYILSVLRERIGQQDDTTATE